MARTPDPPLASLLEAIVRTGLRDLAHARWRPHKVFTSPQEPISAYHQRLAELYRGSRYGEANELDDSALDLAASAIEHARRRPLWSICRAFVRVVQRLGADNELAFDFPALDAAHVGNDVYALPLRRRLDELEPFLVYEERIRERFDFISCALVIGIINDHIPDIALARDGEESDPSAFLSVPLVSLLRAPRDFVAAIMATFLEEPEDDSDPGTSLAFAQTRRQIILNALTVSRLTPEQAHANPTKIITPGASPLEGMDLVEAYLAHTPFVAFAKQPVPFTIPFETRFEHMAIYGGAGAGKTQALQSFIATDLMAPDPPALVIIDSQGEMLPKIERLVLFDPNTGPLRNRLVIVDPEDDCAPALNMFDIPSARLATYARNDREIIEAGIIELYNYIFGAIASELTAKQGTAFAYIVRAMLATPGATIQTLLQMMEDPADSLGRSQFLSSIDTLDPIAQNFFRNQFYSRANAPTRQQVARRLYGILRIPAFVRMFSAPHNRLDLFTALQDGKIVLVNTSKALLKDASAVFGRYMIALSLAAAYERVVLPADKRRPAFLILDEAAEYFDDNIETMLAQARKYKLGLCYATQFLEQMDFSMRAAAAANTAVKFASSVSDRNARELAPDMRTTPDFINSMGKTAGGAQWACHVRNLTPAAVRLTVPFGTLESQPRMSAEQHAKLRQMNRDHYGAMAAIEAPHVAPARETPIAAAQKPQSVPDPPVPGAQSDPSKPSSDVW